MLRTSLRSVRLLGSRSSAAVAGRQWQLAVARPVGLVSRRCYADETPVQPSDAAYETEPPKKKKGFFSRLKTYFYATVFLGSALFAGGVYYARVNDTFHDIFTQYVPGAEQVVMYLEELEFQKKLPPNQVGTPKPPRDTGPKVTIAPQSGASWRVADSTESTSKSSAAPKEKPTPKPTPKLSPEKEEPKFEPPKEAPADVVDSPTPKPAPVSAVPFKAPEVNEPSRMPPAAPVDPLAVNDATDPVVQELVRMINDLITVVNADNANGRFSRSIEKAKAHINKVGQQIQDIKKAAEEDAEKKLQGYVDLVDKKSKEMEAATEAAIMAIEMRHQAEAAEEMEQLRSSFEERMRVMTERERQLNEERLANVLREQAVELTHQFAKDVRSQVESERNARLGKLEQLSAAVKDLAKLTAGWNEVVDINLQTQQLHVAVEAVRACLEDTAHPRPFVRELVALKEIAADNPAVDAAIASINPIAYQQGISSPSLLIDRFRRVATEVRKASLLPDGAGVASHASSWMLSHLMFKKQGLAEGDDVESILTRTQTLLEEGNLDGAAREMNGLHGWAKTLSKDWLDEVRRVLEVQQALDVIATEARLQSLKLE